MTGEGKGKEGGGSNGGWEKGVEGSREKVSDGPKWPTPNTRMERERKGEGWEERQ